MMGGLNVGLRALEVEGLAWRIAMMLSCQIYMAKMFAFLEYLMVLIISQHDSPAIVDITIVFFK